MSETTATLAAQAEVIDLADRLAAAIPDGTRLPLVLNALKHMMSAGVIGAAVSADAARGTARLLAAQMVENTDTLLEHGWRTWN